MSKIVVVMGSQLQDCGTVLVRQVKNPGDIEGRTELQQAFDLGKSLR